jgi:predicted nucleotidyltransferase
MIPHFNNEGNLPEGLYEITLDEMKNKFGQGSSRRNWLMQRLEEIIKIADGTGYLERVIVWGSFVTAKETPNDIDLLLVVSEKFDLEKIRGEDQVIFNYIEGRLKYNADIFWTKSGIGAEALKIFIDTYQITREYNKRGILEVIYDKK